MAHPIETKAKAIAMLMFGTSVTVVAGNLGIPKSTVSRWKWEGGEIMRWYVQRHPEYAWLAKLGRNLRKNGTKKGKDGQ